MSVTGPGAYFQTNKANQPKCCSYNSLSEQQSLYAAEPQIEMSVLLIPGRLFTFTMFAVAFIPRLADTFVWLQGVLADGINAAVVNRLGTLINI